MSFAHPYLLLLLLPLPLFAWLKGRRGRSPAFLYSSVRLMTGLSRARRSQAGAILAALRWLALALLIVALAQPRLVKSTTEVKASGIDIVVALDLSGSMNTPDYEVGGQRISRFNLAKSVLEKFVAERPDDRIGLVVFAARAFLASPLTLDHDYLEDNIERLNIGTINSDATAIGDGLVTALNQLRDVKAKSKIIVLMTDGANNSGQIGPDTATEAAAALGVKVFTIGLGNRDIVEAMGLPPGYLPDVEALQKISQATGGTAYRAENSEKLRQIYTELNQMEKTQAVLNKYTEFKELFAWAVAAGLAVLLLEIVLGQTVLRRLP
jgi:Ca-activated chloride channel family protein